MNRVARELTPAERRALLRRHHPDLGGDAEEFVRVMAAIESMGNRTAPRPAAAATSTTSTTEGTVPSPSREGTAGPEGRPGTGRWRRRGRRAVLRMRSSLPRTVPGSRRYGHL